MGPAFRTLSSVFRPGSLVAAMLVLIATVQNGSANENGIENAYTEFGLAVFADAVDGEVKFDGTRSYFLNAGIGYLFRYTRPRDLSFEAVLTRLDRGFADIDYTSSLSSAKLRR
mgnify:FL=1